MILTLMLMVGNLGNRKGCKKKIDLKPWHIDRKPWHIDTHLRVLNENYPMYTNMTGFRWSSKSLHLCALDEISLSIGKDTFKR